MDSENLKNLYMKIIFPRIQLALYNKKYRLIRKSRLEFKSIFIGERVPPATKLLEEVWYEINAYDEGNNIVISDELKICTEGQETEAKDEDAVKIITVNDTQIIRLSLSIIKFQDNSILIIGIN